MALLTTLSKLVAVRVCLSLSLVLLLQQFVFSIEMREIPGERAFKAASFFSWEIVPGALKVEVRELGSP